MMHDRFDATMYVNAAIKKAVDEMTEDLLSNAYRLFGVARHDGTVIDATAIVIDPDVLALPPPGQKEE